MAAPPTALGFATDLMVLDLSGSEIRPGPWWTVVRTPQNPDYYWGNFLLVAPSALHRAPTEWLAAFAAELPDVGHVAIGLDARREADLDAAAISAAGLALSVDRVLEAARPARPTRPSQATLRPVESARDWQEVRDLRLATADQPDTPPNRLFEERRLAQDRDLVQRGHAVWWGAWTDRTLGAILGVVTDGAGTARYQHVVTHPDLRRQGLAGSLIHAAGVHATEALGAGSLVIVADPQGPALGLYRALGFRSREDQLTVERREPASAANPA